VRVMASFCTKCGTPVTGDNAFCTSCGAPVGAGAAPSAPPAYAAPASTAPAAAAYTPVYATGTAAPAKGGSSALKIILIIVAVFVGLGLLSVAGIMFGIWRVSKAVHVSNNGGGVTLTTPSGTLTAGTGASVTAGDLGVDIYPGANQQQNGSLHITTPKGSEISAVFTTNDSMTQVVDFYKGKLGTGVSVYQSDKSAVLTSTSADNKSSVMVTISTEGNPTPGEGQTKIAIMHTTST